MRLTRRHTFLIFIASTLCLCTGWLFIRQHYFPIRHVKIINRDGYAHVSHYDLKSSLREGTKTHFFAVNFHRIYHQLQAIPWVDAVSIKRVWPDTLEIHIHEKVALAKWCVSGLIDTHSQIFYPTQQHETASLPTLCASHAQANDLLSKYHEYNRKSSQFGLKISKMSINAHDAWTLTFDNGITLLLGREDIDARFERFTTVYPKFISDKHQEVATVDLRYPNGFAVLGRKKI